MHILIAALEFAPYSQLGALGEAVSQLARGLKGEGLSVTLVAPFRGGSQAGGVRLARRLRGLSLSWQGEELELPLWEGALRGNVRLLLVEHPALSEGPLYGDPEAPDAERAARLALLCKAVAATPGQLAHTPDVMHLHDWPMGLVPYYLSQEPGPKPPTVLSLYDLAHQGHYPGEVVSELGIPASDFHPDGLEYYGHLNFLKAGLRYADALVSMGRAHRDELLTEGGGHGMHGLLGHRQEALRAIPLGLDPTVFGPERDEFLAMPYAGASISGKRVCKRALQDELALPGRADRLLLGLVPPLRLLLPDDDLLATVRAITERGVQVAVLPGPGDDLTAWQSLAEELTDRCGVLSMDDDASLHRLLGGADLLVLPNPHAPETRPQSLALAYGTLPLLHGQGVLEQSAEGETLGFEYHPHNAPALLDAVERAQAAWQSQKDWRVRVLAGMQRDDSWQGSARRYAALSRRLLPGSDA